jgi:hypothetical protein
MPNGHYSWNELTAEEKRRIILSPSSWTLFGSRCAASTRYRCGNMNGQAVATLSSANVPRFEGVSQPIRW